MCSRMGSSDELRNIDLLDSAALVKMKIKKAFCAPGDIKENGVLAFLKYVLNPGDGTLLIRLFIFNSVIFLFVYFTVK